MHIFLSTLAGLSITGAALAPAVATNNNQITSNKTVEPQASSQDILFDGTQSISTNQSEATWSFDFDYTKGNKIDRIEFLGGGLSAYVDWGSLNWDHNYSGFDVDSWERGEWVTIFRENHASFLATQTGLLQAKLTFVQGDTFNLSFYFYTQSYNSFTSSTGKLTIGTGIRVITN